MNKKKTVTLIISLVLVAAVGIGATLAYFTDKDSKNNVVTLGKVDISLTETSTEENKEITENGIKFDHIVPGDNISKAPTVNVASDSEKAYIRVRVVTDFKNLLQQTNVDEEKILDLLDVNSKDWERVRVEVEKGIYTTYYYYQGNKGIVNPGESKTLFQHVKIPETWGNEFANGSFSLYLFAEAIQADNVTPTTNANGKIVGWPNVEIKEYTAPK